MMRSKGRDPAPFTSMHITAAAAVPLPLPFPGAHHLLVLNSAPSTPFLLIAALACGGAVTLRRDDVIMPSLAAWRVCLVLVCL